MAKVLIVDDKENNLVALETVLKVLNVEIVRAMGGEEALRATLNHDFALAILDVQMPGMDGYELASLLRSDDMTKSIPIILLSAVYSDDLHVFKGYELGAVDFITKPFNAEVLLSKVRVFLALYEQRAEIAQRKEELERLVERLEDEIHERKKVQEQKAQLEAQLRRMHKLEAIATLAGGFAHDFNNLLSPILGYTEMALSDLPKTSPMHSDLKQVLRAGHRARDLVRQILSFSRMEDGNERIPVPMGPIVKESLALLRSTLPDTIQIEHNIAHESGKVLVDVVQMHQMLFNLCTNAAHAMEREEGRLQVSLEEVHVAPDPSTFPPHFRPGHCLKLTVSDTGHGIAPEAMERIFDPYFTTKEVGKGSGLGLAVVQGILTRHGGAVHVHSKPGEGSTFEIFLPQFEDKSLTEWVPPTPAFPEQSTRVLLVDDEDMLLALGCRMLERLGCTVTTRSRSSEALELFRTHPDDFDIVMSNYSNPHPPGPDLAGEMMRIRPDIPMILCTGFNETLSEDDARELGFRGLVMKPYNLRDLENALRRALNRP